MNGGQLRYMETQNAGGSDEGECGRGVNVKPDGEVRRIFSISSEKTGGDHPLSFGGPTFMYHRIARQISDGGSAPN